MRREASFAMGKVVSCEEFGMGDSGVDAAVQPARADSGMGDNGALNAGKVN